MELSGIKTTMNKEKQMNEIEMGTFFTEVIDNAIDEMIIGLSIFYHEPSICWVLGYDDQLGASVTGLNIDFSTKQKAELFRDNRLIPFIEKQRVVIAKNKK